VIFFLYLNKIVHCADTKASTYLYTYLKLLSFPTPDEYLSERNKEKELRALHALITQETGPTKRRTAVASLLYHCELSLSTLRDSEKRKTCAARKERENRDTVSEREIVCERDPSQSQCSVEAFRLSGWWFLLGFSSFFFFIRKKLQNRRRN
jgi:hypothetical protein